MLSQISVYLRVKDSANGIKCDDTRVRALKIFRCGGRCELESIKIGSQNGSQEA